MIFWNLKYWTLCIVVFELSDKIVLSLNNTLSAQTMSALSDRADEKFGPTKIWADEKFRPTNNFRFS